MSATVPQELPLEAELQEAIAHHQAGRFEQAETRYLDILKAQPYHAIANHNMGLLAGQVGQYAAGLPYLRQALSVNPDEGQFWLSYADGLIKAGQAGEALDILDSAYKRGLDNPSSQALRLQAETAVSEAAKAPSDAEIGHIVAIYNSGDYVQLEDATRALLAQYPESAFAWSVLGTALQLQGKDALQVLQKTVELAPCDAEAHGNLGNAWQMHGQFERAVDSYLRALDLNPDFVEAHRNLGRALHVQHRLADAEQSYRRALALHPSYAVAHLNLGNVLREQEKFEAAIASYHDALKLIPDNAEAHSHLALALEEIGQREQALAFHERSVALDPESELALLYLSDCLRKLRRFDEAASLLQNALAKNPGNAEMHNNLGLILQNHGKLEEAIAAYQQAVDLAPDFAMAYCNMGAAQQALKQFDKAQANYLRALENEPRFVLAHFNLATCWRELGQYDTALAGFQQVIAIQPNHIEAYVNIAGLLGDAGRIDEAIDSCRTALSINPTFEKAHSSLLFMLSHSIRASADSLFAEHQRFGDVFEAPLRASWPEHSNSRAPERCLQVGFVSGDFNDHAVPHFVIPILENLCRSPRLSLHAYYNCTREDAVTKRLRGLFPHWQQVSALSDAELAKQIAEDGIDVLIDLSGHTAKHRLLTFTRKPAPIQASWIGYPGSTGLQAVDYFLTDRFVLPPGRFESQYTEKFAYLPAAWPYLPSSDAPEVNSLPALANGCITFASFNRTTKLSREVIALWSQLLRAVPTSRMLLAAMPKDGVHEQWIEWFASEGISQDRLSFHPRTNVKDYLALHLQVDIALDTFPYTGGTTTLNGLWMGVPTLTLAGDTTAGRTSAAILGHVQLDAFVAEDAEDFVKKGAYIANDLALLASIRGSARQLLANSALGQPALIAAGLEAALRAMWQRWCAGLPAASFEVDQQTTRNTLP
ncbi:tetratricopeptide repeat protein [Janthinobacterium fluminis]|uniref:protein O-GlcNAc transferase n=1 Tax=Janthinobacterium fluminis TaxID=2987524 RepID=A0ABT5JUU9_9BURK|nr:tetratricopeptide repeat protein [Janthinobacterium fluminis]MDC8756515.1 tetratricopeptide repeat protein [Janthinobacterium fluminis]